MNARLEVTLPLSPPVEVVSHEGVRFMGTRLIVWCSPALFPQAPVLVWVDNLVREDGKPLLCASWIRQEQIPAALRDRVPGWVWDAAAHMVEAVPLPEDAVLAGVA